MYKKETWKVLGLNFTVLRGSSWYHPNPVKNALLRGICHIQAKINFRLIHQPAAS